jgi:VanZ family protein
MDLQGNRPRWLFAGLVAVAIVFWMAMFAGTHLPIQVAPKNDAYSLDKLQHLGAFCCLAILLCAIGAALGVRAAWLYGGVLVVMSAYGLFDEATQALVSNRQPDLLDWLADVCGAAVGVGLAAMVQLALARWRRRLTPSG